MISEHSDEALARLVVSGDAAAFAHIYERHKQAVYARLTRILGPVPEREDVLQLVFLRLFRALPAFRGESSLAGFLYRIMSNAAMDHLRGKMRRPPEYPDDELEELAATIPDPERHSHARHQLKTLFGLLDKLSPNRRVAFVLVAIEGISPEDAAEQLGISEAALKQRVFLARTQLAELFARQEGASQRVSPSMAWRPS